MSKELVESMRELLDIMNNNHADLYLINEESETKNDSEDDEDSKQTLEDGKKSKGFYSGAWNQAEKHTKYDPPKTGNKGKSARRGFVG